MLDALKNTIKAYCKANDTFTGFTHPRFIERCPEEHKIITESLAELSDCSIAFMHPRAQAELGQYHEQELDFETTFVHKVHCSKLSRRASEELMKSSEGDALRFLSAIQIIEQASESSEKAVSRKKAAEIIRFARRTLHNAIQDAVNITNEE